VDIREPAGCAGPGDEATQLLKNPRLIGAFDQRLTCRAIKISFDGALGSKGAALLQKYSDHDTNGFLKWKDDDLLPMFEQALREGVQCARSNHLASTCENSTDDITNKREKSTASVFEPNQ
jgi:hypothetical protein